MWQVLNGYHRGGQRAFDPNIIYVRETHVYDLFQEGYYDG